MINEILDRVKFPCHLKEAEGEELKRVFLEKKTEKGHNRHYYYEIDGYRYTLLEELLFDENNPFLELNKVIGKNFLLNREKI